MKKLFALLLVVSLSIFACGNTVDPNKKSEGSLTYSEYMDAAVGSQVVVEGFVQAKHSWWNDTVTFYMQDGDGAYFVYDAVCSEADYAKLEIGTKVKVTGPKANWKGEVEIYPSATLEILEGDTYIAEAVDVTAKLGSDDLINYQNQKVTFKGLTIAASKNASGEDVPFLYNWDGSGAEGSNSDLYFKASKDGETYTFCVESYLTSEGTAGYEAVEALKIGDVVDMEGYLYWYEGAEPHITSVTVK